MDYNILIGGAAGQGMDTVASMLNQVLKRAGYELWTNSDYLSRVRGGHNFFQIRFSDEKLTSHRDELDMIFALNGETVEKHYDRLREGGLCVADEGTKTERDIRRFPMTEKAKELGNEKMITAIGLGIIMKYFGIPVEIGEEVIRGTFNEKLADMNIDALDYGFSLVEPIDDLEIIDNDRLLIDGNQAVGLGAVAAGCRFYCGYPMTPSSGVLDFMFRASAKLPIVVDQVEDEVAALNMALGASFAGVRAMTGSSGGGLALMQEALSMAGIIETPVVVIDVMRPGPATGLPTYTSQGDLNFLVHGGHGEFPRFVTAPRTAEDAFWTTVRSFDLAEKYQIPAIILSDKYLGEVATSVEPFDLESIEINRYLADPSDYGPKEYRRYEITDDGVSPRLYPGQSEDNFVMVDSDEHNEWGRIEESAENRVKMVDKRARKKEGLKKDLEEPWEFGADDYDALAICFGSVYGPLKEAVDLLNADGEKIKALAFGDVYPLPTEKLKKYATDDKKIIVVEQNHDGQFEGLLRKEALLAADESIRKYDGRQMSRDWLMKQLREVL